MADKKKIANRLRSLEDIPGVSVIESDGGDTVRIEHSAHHSLAFRFRWIKTHFAGYFVDKKGHESQAVVHLRTGIDAIHFASAYSSLAALRAKKKRA
jgi:hypothetical protein